MYIYIYVYIYKMYRARDHVCGSRILGLDNMCVSHGKQDCKRISAITVGCANMCVDIYIGPENMCVEVACRE